jgi:hypothetical protein
MWKKGLSDSSLERIAKTAQEGTKIRVSVKPSTLSDGSEVFAVDLYLGGQGGIMFDMADEGSANELASSLQGLLDPLVEQGMLVGAEVVNG